MRFLRQNTAVIITVGPFLDATNGVSEETGLTVTNCHLVMTKDDDDGTAVNTIIDTTCTASGGDNDLVHIAHGIYSLELTQAQTNYVGRVLLQVSDPTNHCAVFHEFMILPAKVFDSVVLGTDNLEVDVTQVAGAATTATLDSVAGQISAIGSGTGAALNFAADDDNADNSVSGVALTAVGSATGTYSNTAADDTSTHVIASSGNAIDWAYGFSCGAARAASKVTWKGTLSGGPGASDQFTFYAYNWSTDSWDVRLVVTNTSSATQTFDIPLLAAHTGTSGTEAGKVVVRIYFSEADAGTLTTNLLLVQAQVSGSLIGYANGSIWVKTSGTAGTTPYVHGTADNPCPWDNAVTLSSSLGMTRFTVTPGTSITLGAALAGAVITGRSYSLALGGQNVSGSYFEGVEGLSGTGTCATAEAIIADSHVSATTIGEADFVRCHLMGTVTMSQASVPYRFHDCTGITSAKITFAAASQSAVVSRVSGVLTVAGMVSTNTLYIDGDCDLTLDATNTGGTVYLAGNVRLTNSGTGQTIQQDGHFSRAGLVDNIWDEPTSGHTTQGTFGRRVKNIAEDVVWTGTAQAGSTSNTIVLDSGASSTDGAYDPAAISIITGTGAGQTRNILQYTGSSRTAVVDRDWRVTPSTDSEFVITANAGREHVNEGLAQAGASSTITLNTNASSANNAYNGQIVFIRSGTGADQARRVGSYDGATKVATLTRAWAVTPDATSAYVMLPTGALSYECIREAVWNAILADYDNVSGSTGEALANLTPGTGTATRFVGHDGVLDFGPGVTGQTEIEGFTTIDFYRLDTGAAWSDNAVYEGLVEIGDGIYALNMTGQALFPAPLLVHAYQTSDPTIEAWSTVGETTLVAKEATLGVPLSSTIAGDLVSVSNLAQGASVAAAAAETVSRGLWKINTEAVICEGWIRGVGLINFTYSVQLGDGNEICIQYCNSDGVFRTFGYLIGDSQNGNYFDLYNDGLGEHAAPEWARFVVCVGNGAVPEGDLTVTLATPALGYSTMTFHLPAMPAGFGGKHFIRTSDLRAASSEPGGVTLPDGDFYAEANA